MKKPLIIIGSVVCIFVILLYFYNSFRPEYVYENGSWNYVSYDEAVGRRLNKINVSKGEFKILKYDNFARDNKSVYYKCEKIEGSDPDTFQIISDKGRYRYAKDKNNVYVYISNDACIFKIINADPNSFEILQFPYSKDKKDAFCGCLPLYVDDVTKFKVIESTGLSTMSTVDSFLGTKSGLIDKSSEYEVNKLEYNRKRYPFITDWVFYSEQGKAKTDKLTYEGYRLVEDQRLK